MRSHIDYIPFSCVACAEMVSMRRPLLEVGKTKIVQQKKQEEEEEYLQRRNVFPVGTYESLCLVVSSCFFLFPCCYASFVDLPLYSAVSFVTTVVSANYWRHAVEGVRRNADLVVAKVSFVIYCASGFWYARDWEVYSIGLPALAGIGVCYYLSNRYWERDLPHWVYFQMFFHFFVALEQALVIYAITIALTS